MDETSQSAILEIFFPWVSPLPKYTGLNHSSTPGNEPKKLVPDSIRAKLSRSSLNPSVRLHVFKMEADLYDEFGNYIGPELDSDEESEDEDEIGEDEAAEYVS